MIKKISRKKLIIIMCIIAISLIFIIFFTKNNYKNIKTGNNMSNKNIEEIEEYILNISSYEATIQVTIESNKSTNKYILSQQYMSPNKSKLIVLEPSNIAGLEIINDLQEISEQFSEKYNLNYEVFATPSRRIEESFLKKDQMQFGIIPGVTDKKEYTNSNFIPIAYDLSIEEKAKIESAYHELTKGGNLFCVKLEEAEAEKPENIEKIVDLMDKYNLGYASIQIKKARCLRCGYEENDIKIKNCPNCGSEKIEIV